MTLALKLADERREGREAGRKEGLMKGDLNRAKKTASNMLKQGSSLGEVAEILELPIETILSWSKEADISDTLK